MKKRSLKIKDKIKLLELPELIEYISNFIDKHDIIMPEIKVKINNVELTISGKRV